MASLFFHYATMNAGKSTQLLQVNFNYQERGMKCLLLTAAIDDRYGTRKIASRIGIEAEAEVFAKNDNLLERFLIRAKVDGVAAVLVDEAQFLTSKQVAQLASAVDRLGLPVMAYGLRSDFRGRLFEGSSALFELADKLVELKTICHCGKRATMVMRKDESGHPTFDGDQVQIGGNDTYTALCRRHWMEAHDAATMSRSSQN